MPLIFKKEINPSTLVSVWDIQEDNEHFIQQLDLDTQELESLNMMKPHRKREWLTSRHLLHEVCPSVKRIPISKDNHGKPLLFDKSFHISISHSQNRVAVMRSPLDVGIDIQHEEAKITRIQHKFISPKEFQSIDEDHILESYHLFWGAKECMYKAYGKRELEFRDHMHLYPFKYYQEHLELSGWVRKGDLAQDYNIYAEKLDDYFLTYAILDN